MAQGIDAVHIDFSGSSLNLIANDAYKTVLYVSRTGISIKREGVREDDMIYVSRFYLDKALDLFDKLDTYGRRFKLIITPKDMTVTIINDDFDTVYDLFFSIESNSLEIKATRHAESFYFSDILGLAENIAIMFAEVK